MLRVGSLLKKSLENTSVVIKNFFVKIVMAGLKRPFCDLINDRICVSGYEVCWNVNQFLLQVKAKALPIFFFFLV